MMLHIRFLLGTMSVDPPILSRFCYCGDSHQCSLVHSILPNYLLALPHETVTSGFANMLCLRGQDIRYDRLIPAPGWAVFSNTEYSDVQVFAILYLRIIEVKSNIPFQK